MSSTMSTMPMPQMPGSMPNSTRSMSSSNGGSRTNNRMNMNLNMMDDQISGGDMDDNEFADWATGLDRLSYTKLLDVNARIAEKLLLEKHKLIDEML